MTSLDLFLQALADKKTLTDCIITSPTNNVCL